MISRNQVTRRQRGTLLGKVNSVQGHRRCDHMTLRHDVMVLVVVAVRVDNICQNADIGGARGSSSSR